MQFFKPGYFLIMNSPIPVTAIFDIGKTNKKFLLFNRKSEAVYQREVRLDETVDDDGYPCEDLQQMVAWMKESFREAVLNRSFRIAGLNIAAYGATLVHLDENGEVAAPLYNYLKPFPEELQQQFYHTYGGRKPFSLQTASPPLGMLNSGLQLYWLKHGKPDMFRKIATTLHLPQFLVYLFSGRLSSELTSIGCHTAMWDFAQGGYHRWIQDEEMMGMFPEIEPVSTVVPIEYDGLRLDAGIGIHDSSAALAPYLYAMEEPFILLSTGTWNIAMNPFTDEPLTYEELEKDGLLYLNIYGKPVKASRLFLGSKYSRQVRKLGSFFGRNRNEMDCSPDPAIFRKILAENHPERKLKTEKTRSDGPETLKKPELRDVSVFNTYEEACHQLMLDLVVSQLESLNLVMDKVGDRSGGHMAADAGGHMADDKHNHILVKNSQYQTREKVRPGQIIITGGFSKNVFYTRLLASFLPHTKIHTATTSNASALGASLVLSETSKERAGLQSLLGLERHEPFENLNLERYR